jgi:hypothetical protein
MRPTIPNGASGLRPDAYEVLRRAYEAASEPEQPDIMPVPLWYWKLCKRIEEDREMSED